MEDDRQTILTDRLLEILYGWVLYTSSFRSALRGLLHLQKIQPKTSILNISHHCNRAWFSGDCYVAAYAYNDSETLNVVRIYLPQDIFTDFPSFLQDKPAHLKLLIIEGEELLYIQKEGFNELKTLPETFELLQHVMLKEQELEAWRVWIMTLKDEQKIHQFSLRYPMNLLPNHICASFLQMTPSRYSAAKANYNRK